MRLLILYLVVFIAVNITLDFDLRIIFEPDPNTVTQCHMTELYPSPPCVFASVLVYYCNT